MKNVHSSILVLSLFSLFTAHSEAQSPISNLSDYLLKSNFNGLLYWQKPEEKLIQFDQGLKCYTAKHNYLWYKKRFTIQLDGSGRLFQVSDRDSVERLDQTCYEGYNFDAFHFVFHDTLFSLGGYGYWQFNSQLRFYDEKVREWSVIPTNKKIPVRFRLFSQVYFDSENQRLYIIYIDPEINDEIYGTYNYSTLFVQCLDLTTKKWWDQQKVFSVHQNPSLNLFMLRSPSISLKKGLMLITQNETFILDFKNNKLFKLNKAIHQSIMSLWGTLTHWMAIPEPSGVSFFNPENSSIQKVEISDSSLISLPSNIYAEDTKEDVNISFKGTRQLLATSFLSLIIIFMLFYTKSLRSKLKTFSSNGALEIPNDKQRNHEYIDVDKPLFRKNLTEVENALLDLLVTNTTRNQNTTVNEINHAIGVSKKATSIQNNIRAATILMINKKFMAFSGIREDLIQKERTEFDKRFFEYYIHKKYISKI